MTFSNGRHEPLTNPGGIHPQDLWLTALESILSTGPTGLSAQELSFTYSAMNEGATPAETAHTIEHMRALSQPRRSAI